MIWERSGGARVSGSRWYDRKDDKRDGELTANDRIEHDAPGASRVDAPRSQDDRGLSRWASRQLLASVVATSGRAKARIAKARQSQTGGAEADETVWLPDPGVALGEDSAGRTRSEPSAAVAPPDEGFVPLRRLASLGTGKCGETEYRTVGRLGSGGTGVVYQAHQRSVDREVAVKVLRDELARDPEARSRFLAEARVIGALDHPNVIALHELGVDCDGHLFYSMKRVDGTSWDQRIETQSQEENLETLLRVADGIRYAHSRGLIHRDLKPENVMLGQFGEVLLADWGLALSHATAAANGSPHRSAIGGTPAYMAPELALGDASAISFGTDIYLLGAILFQVMTGYPPHHGESLLACIRSAAANEIRPTRVNGELMEIAMRAMASRPEDRFATVDEFIAAIQDHRIHQQSVRLVRRARERIESAGTENHYEAFRVADALLREAVEVWPGNKAATKAIHELQLDFARAAAARGDLDLALALYEVAGEGESEASARLRVQIKERRQSEERQAKYSTLFTASPEAGLLVRLSSGEVVEANPAFVELLGYAEEEIVGRRIPDLNLWACPERRIEFVEKLRQGGSVENLEVPFVHRDGRRVDVLVSARSTEVAGEEMLISTIRDISQRKAAENELARSRRRLRELQRMAGLGTWSFDVATQQITWSEETYRMLRRDPSLGPPSFEEYLDSIHPDDRERMRATILTSLENGTAYELRVRQRVGEIGYQRFIARGQPVQDDDGNTVELYGVVLPDESRIDAKPAVADRV